MKIALYAIAALLLVVGVWLSLTWEDYFADPVAIEEAEADKALASASAKGGARRGDDGRQGDDAAYSEPRVDGFKSRGKDGLPVGNFEPTEILVSNPPENFENAVKGMNFSIIERMTLDTLDMKVFRLRTPEGHTVRTGVKLLREKFPGVAIDANHQFDPSADPKELTVPKAAAPMLSYVRAAAGWGNAAMDCGRNLRIGVIDGVVRTKHPALRGQKIEFRSYHRPNRRVGPADHGTAIAAMFVGRPSEQGWGGIFPGAQLLAANMFEYNKDGRLVGSAGALIKALDWMIESKVHVVNFSLAGEDNTILRSVIERARQMGVVMVAAGGNWGRSDRPAYPAAYPAVIAVTAFDAKHAAYKLANRGDYIDFAAPGVKMWTAVPGGGRYQSGSSFATPYISALAAELVRKRKLKSAADVKDVLKDYVVDLGAAGKDTTFGWGFVARAPGCK